MISTFAGDFFFFFFKDVMFTFCWLRNHQQIKQEKEDALQVILPQKSVHNGRGISSNGRALA